MDPDQPVTSLVDAVVSGTSAAEEAAFTLLRHIRRRDDMDALLELVRAPTLDAAKAAAWIFSELGTQAAQVLDGLRPLLTHGSAYVRYFAMDCLVANAALADADLIAIGIGGLADDDYMVRAQAMALLSVAPEPTLSSALPPRGSRPAAEEDERMAVVRAVRDGADDLQTVLETATRSPLPEVEMFASAQLRRRRHRSSRRTSSQSADTAP